MISRDRPPAVAGLFYPGDAWTCRWEVEGLLKAAEPGPAGAGPPVALLVPHAGYCYSGAVAARAYREVPVERWLRGPIAILGPNHRAPLDGLAVDIHRAFSTPLGRVQVAPDAVRALIGSGHVIESEFVHCQEHCIEVQLPFLQVLATDCRIVPIVVGRCAPERVAAAIAVLVEDFDALILVSSDLSHFLPYERAVQVDAGTASRLAGLDTAIRPDQACGSAAINGLHSYGRRRDWQARVLELANSGDTSGDRDRVVGYGACVYSAA